MCARCESVCVCTRWSVYVCDRVCAHSFPRSLTSLTPKLVGKCMILCLNIIWFLNHSAPPPLPSPPPPHLPPQPPLPPPLQLARSHRSLICLLCTACFALLASLTCSTALIQSFACLFACFARALRSLIHFIRSLAHCAHSQARGKVYNFMSQYHTVLYNSEAA